MTIILVTIVFVTRIIINNYIDHKLVFGFKKKGKYKLGINWLLILIRSSCRAGGWGLRIG
jgi:hypothetical protein